MKNRILQNLLLAGTTVIALTLPALADACTRVLFTPPGRAVLVGNNMDWPEDLHADLLVFPKGYGRRARVEKNPLTWVSRYGSIVAAPYGEKAGATGMNEQGLAVHLLGLGASDYGPRDTAVPGLSIDLWAQFYLDRFASVAEAVEYTRNNRFQVVTFVDPRAGKILLHLAMEDASGDSAIFEYVNGQLVIHHDRAYTVLTNDPVFELQQQNLLNYAGLGGDKPLPGTTFPPDRFVRASYYLKHMSTTTSDREAVFKLFSILQNAGQPYGTNTPERNQGGIIFESLWRTVSDLTHRIFYFNSTMRFNTFQVSLNAFNLEPGAPVMMLDLQSDEDYSGDATDRFRPLPA